MRIQGLLYVLLLVTHGCGAPTQPPSPDKRSDAEAGDESLDCAWLARSNCWDDALRELALCVPAVPAIGRLSSDGACVFASGEIITSRTAFSDGVATFVGGPGQRACGMVQMAEGEWRLGTLLGTTTVSTQNGRTQVNCHDGRVALTENAASLEDCSSAFTEFQLAMTSGKLTIGADYGDAPRWLCE